MNALPVMAIVASFVMSLGARAEVDYSGYWRITRDTHSTGAQNKVVELVQNNMFPDKWDANFWRPQTCEVTGNKQLTFFNVVDLRKKGLGSAQRCATRKFYGLCPDLVNPDPDTRDFKNKDPYDADLVIKKVKPDLIRGTYTTRGYWAPGDGSPCEVNSKYDESYDFELVRMSCAGGGVPQDQDVTKAYEDWVGERFEDFASSLDKSSTATLRDGYERAVAASCLPAEVIIAFRHFVDQRTMQTCQDSCFITGGWFRRVAGEASQKIPFENWESSCNTRCPSSPSTPPR